MKELGDDPASYDGVYVLGRRPPAQSQRYAGQSLLALGRVLGREYALRNAVSTYDAATIASAIESFHARIQSDIFFIADDQGLILAVVSGGDDLRENLSKHPAVQNALHGEEALPTNLLVFECRYRYPTTS